MDFKATHHQLPDGLGYVSSLPGQPCGCCHEAVFDVVIHSRQSRLDDGVTREWESVDVQCPHCDLLTNRRGVVGKRVIGSLDTRTGRLLLA